MAFLTVSRSNVRRAGAPLCALAAILGCTDGGPTTPATSHGPSVSSVTAAAPSGFGSCAEVKAADPGAADGEYTLHLGGQRVTLYCHDMATDPKEYLPLVKVGGLMNYSRYAAGGFTPGTDVVTHFQRLRLDPATLVVDCEDLTFATSVGQVGDRNHMSYAVAADCVDCGSSLGRANIDLRRTPFVVADNFVTEGYIASGGAAFSSRYQVVELSGGGCCGATRPGGPDSDPNPEYGPFRLQLGFKRPR